MNEVFDNVKIIYDHNILIINKKDIYLRPKEMDIFSIVYDKKGIPVRLETIVQAIWGRLEGMNSINSLQVHINNINRKTRPHGISLQNIRGRGYKIAETRPSGKDVTNEIVEINGEKKTAREWATLYGVAISTLYSTYSRRKPIEHCFRKLAS
jgi:DNA-binding winged helix-turn-helix (wHTH) protein